MKKKKITQKEWEYIGKYNYAAKWGRKFCTYYLIKEEGYGFHRQQELGIILYILLFIPFTILQFFYCCWGEGLKNFSFLKKTLGIEHFIDNKKANEIWGKK